MVGGGRPVLCGNELKKTGARSAQPRTRGQNPLVCNIDEVKRHSVFVYNVIFVHAIQEIR